MGDFHSSKNFAVAIGLANVLCMLRIPTKNLNNIIGLAEPKKKCLRLGLLWSLITFATLAFISHCQCQPSRVLLPLVFFLISIHFTTASEIPPTVLHLGSFHRLSQVELWDLTANLVYNFWIILG
jgi:hypothetical protein